MKCGGRPGLDILISFFVCKTEVNFGTRFSSRLRVRITLVMSFRVFSLVFTGLPTSQFPIDDRARSVEQDTVSLLS